MRSTGNSQGSEFIVAIPISRDRLLASVEEPPDDAIRSGVLRRVLVVDDNVASADSLGLIIRLWGHECRVAHTGPEAIGEAEVFRPDVVLLDIGLPGMDGYEAARALRSLPELEGLVLIAMTGYGRDEDRRRTAEAGFDQHMVKPLDLDALEITLAHLGEREQAPSPPS